MTKAKNPAPAAKRVRKPKAPVAPLATSEARHAWLEDALAFCSTLLTLCANVDVPERTRITIGWPGVGGARGKRIGECWASEASADRHFELFISPKMHESTELLGVVLHELIHAAVGLECGHKAPFKRAALACGLTGKMTATTPGDELRALFAAYVARHGAYPAGELAPLLSPTKKQKTNLLKAECDACGCVFRITAKWVRAEMICPIAECGGAVTVDGFECEESDDD